MNKIRDYLRRYFSRGHQGGARYGEQSFTLIETVIALGLMVTVIFEVAGVQGNAIYFSEFERNVTKATWIAKGLMSKIEYEWNTRPFTELKDLNVTEREFEDDKGYTYAISIEEWKLPLLDLLTGGASGDEAAENPQGDMIKAYVEKIFGDEVLKIAHVEVFWPEGAKKDSVALTTLLTNQKKLDELIATLPPIRDAKVVAGEQGKAPTDGTAPPKPVPPGNTQLDGGGGNGDGDDVPPPPPPPIEPEG